MGTHNRLLSIASARYPGAYLEIIAINTEAAYAHSAGAKRWFDLENEALQLSLKQHGPQFIHFVARAADIRACTRALTGLGNVAANVFCMLMTTAWESLNQNTSAFLNRLPASIKAATANLADSESVWRL